MPRPVSQKQLDTNKAASLHSMPSRRYSTSPFLRGGGNFTYGLGGEGRQIEKRGANEAALPASPDRERTGQKPFRAHTIRHRWRVREVGPTHSGRPPLPPRTDRRMPESDRRFRAPSRALSTRTMVFDVHSRTAAGHMQPLNDLRSRDDRGTLPPIGTRPFVSVAASGDRSVGGTYCSLLVSSGVAQEPSAKLQQAPEPEWYRDSFIPMPNGLE